MSGIAGIFNLDEKPVERPHLMRMTRTLAHRGPDGEGFYLKDALGLGHTRLSVVDHAKPANLPMANEDQTIWITSDGTIFNYLELRPLLEARGHRFQTGSDTEVILHAYEEYGLTCLQKLEGIFAFALWDGERRRLWLVRDRLGVKPLFYSINGDTFLFGSEIKAVLAHPAIQPRIDFDALSLYLSLSYVPAPYTLFKGVRQLLPGEFLTISPEHPVPELQGYWDVPYPLPRFEGSLSNACEILSEHLEDSVRMRVIGEVASGTVLNGGLNSSATAYWMARATNETLRTFSISFQGHQLSDLPHSRRISQWLNTRHTERVLSLEPAKALPTIIWHAEEPAADPSMVPFYYLSQLARQDVKMLLSSEGGDELFAGHPAYASSMFGRLMQALPSSLVSRFPLPSFGYLPHNGKKADRNDRRSIFKSRTDPSGKREQDPRRLIFSDLQKGEILKPEILQQWDTQVLKRVCDPYFNGRAGCHPLDQMLYIETRFHVPNNLLFKIDRMSMAHGLEVRMPMLDPTLMGFVATLPPEYRSHRKGRKHILGQAMTEHLPSSLIERRKPSQDMPLGEWLLRNLRAFIFDTLTPSSIRATGFLQPEGVHNLLDDYAAGRPDAGQQVWGLLVLMLWWKQFIKGS